MLKEIADTKASIWISASAGTGKTKCLIDRILALLLNGASPKKILCLTYTRAAAYEMLTRLSNYAKKLSDISDDELKTELASLGFDETKAKIARTLYEQSLNHINWVQIKTIHSFCFGILEKFPIETGLLPGIKLCDAYQAKKLLNESVREVLSDKRYYNFCTCISEYTTDILEVLESNERKFSAFFSKYDDFPMTYADFFDISSKMLNMDNKQLNNEILKEVFGAEYKAIFLDIADVLLRGEAEDIEKSKILRKSLLDGSSDFIGAFLTEKGTARARICSKKLSNSYPNFLDKMNTIAKKVIEFCDYKKRVVSANTNIAFFSIIREILFKFNKLKLENHFISFEDVITITLTLLNNIEWVMYKIDGAVDHILVDEAQDTSSEQWEIIKIITDEFFNHSESQRTVFVVGDEKQSIFSFQGADVRLFDQMHSYFCQRSLSCGQRFYNLVLNESYRTTGNILSFVDDVFCKIFPNIKHISNRESNSGIVEVVNLFEERDTFTDTQSESLNNSVTKLEPSKKMSEYIANFISNTIKNAVFVKSKNRAAIASDFLILFQRRDIKCIKAIIKALKDAEVNVTGIDRVLLKDELIVEDLIVLAEFAISPNDDLACARVLRSPVVGFTEKDLMYACIDRKSENLWDYLLNNSELYQKYSLDKLKIYLDSAFRLSASEFFMYVLTDGAKEKFISRLGEKCLDALWEFLDIIMLYEKENNPSLQSFLEWFISFEHEIKRENFSGSDCVKIMTVHASKGLQAPFVILADTHFFRVNGDKIMVADDGILLWNFSSEAQPIIVSKVREKYSEFDLEESNRLLYVAMTRAEDFLYILGEQKARKLHESCWYNIINYNLDAKKFSKLLENDVGLIRIGDYFYKNAETHEKIEEISNFLMNSEKLDDYTIPKWFFEKVEQQQGRQDKNIKIPEAIYGDMVHHLLNKIQSSHKLSDKDFFDIASDFLSDFEASDDEKKAAILESYNALRNPELSFLFDQSSISEFSFIYEGKIGRIDKIAFKENDIWIVDFKTGRFSNSPEIPTDYVQQLSFYKKALNEVLAEDFSKSNKNIKTAILWTKTIKLVEISDT